MTARGHERPHPALWATFPVRGEGFEKQSRGLNPQKIQEASDMHTSLTDLQLFAVESAPAAADAEGEEAADAPGDSARRAE